MIKFANWKTKTKRFVSVHREVARAYVGASVDGLSLRLECDDGRSYTLRIEGRDLERVREAVGHLDDEQIFKRYWEPSNR